MCVCMDGVCSDQQRGHSRPPRRLDGQRAPLDGPAVGRRRRSVVRAGLHAGRGGDGVLRRGRRVAVP